MSQVVRKPILKEIGAVTKKIARETFLKPPLSMYESQVTIRNYVTKPSHVN